MKQAERDKYARGCHFFDSVYGDKRDGGGVVCTHVGVAQITQVVVKRHAPDKFEARVGVAIFGSCNDPDTGWMADAFAEDFPENYCKGEGSTEAEALEAMRKDMREMSLSLV